MGISQENPQQSTSAQQGNLIPALRPGYIVPAGAAAAVLCIKGGMRQNIEPSRRWKMNFTSVLYTIHRKRTVAIVGTLAVRSQQIRQEMVALRREGEGGWRGNAPYW